MNLPVRYSPSGTVLNNSTGGPLTFGPGARLRLTELNSPMGGLQAIPTVADDTSVLASDGFGGIAPLLLELDGPKPSYSYRAKVALDVLNTSTNTEGQVVLYLDASVDGGTTYTVIGKNVHLIAPLAVAGQASARSMELYVPLSGLSPIGMTDATASVKLRARAQAQAEGVAGSLLVSSLDSATPVTGLSGTIHMELEECF